jgi:hypothetical protein
MQMSILSYSCVILGSHDLSKWIGGLESQGWGQFISSPTNICQSVTSLCNYYQRFVKGFNNIVKPLTQQTHIDQEFIWDEAWKQAFQELKTKLSSTPILKWPIWRPSVQLHTDWSTVRLGVVDDDGREFVVAYAN